DLSEKLHHIIAIGKNQQAKKQYHSNYLSHFHKFIAGFASGNYLVEQKHHMATIECRDRQQIQYGQHNGKKGSETPETFPVKNRCKNGTKRNTSTQTFIGFHLGREEKLELLEVASNAINSFLYPGRYGLCKIVMPLAKMEEISELLTGINTYQSLL